MKYDYLIVGAGFFGSVCARELTDKGYKCLVIENRPHIGGNCYTEERNNINIHLYGAHIFHTSNKEVWDYINKFAEFNDYRHHVVANYKNEIYSLPFSMWTFSKLWNITKPEEANTIIKEQGSHIDEPTNFEEQAIKSVGIDVYTKLIKGYTKKQWRKEVGELPKEIIKRLPVRFTYDNNYFYDKYQGIPIGGYTKIFEKLLYGVEVILSTDFFENKEMWVSNTKNIIYTGPIDRYYDYCYGELEYKTTEFNHIELNTSNFQGHSVVNYTDEDIEYTRIIEHKHFEKSESDSTWITYEYPVEYFAGKTEPYYPVNDFDNNVKYKKYKELSESESNVIFGGRLGEYKYYDMDEVIESALNFIKKQSKTQ